MLQGKKACDNLVIGARRILNLVRKRAGGLAKVMLTNTCKMANAHSNFAILKNITILSGRQRSEGKGTMGAMRLWLCVCLVALIQAQQEDTTTEAANDPQMQQDKTTTERSDEQEPTTNDVANEQEPTTTKPQTTREEYATTTNAVEPTTTQASTIPTTTTMPTTTTATTTTTTTPPAADLVRWYNI